MAAPRQHGPALRLGPLNAYLQQARLANARLPCYQEDREAISQQMIQESQFLVTPHKRRRGEVAMRRRQASALSTGSRVSAMASGSLKPGPLSL
jgi:hypothetical protein